MASVTSFLEVISTVRVPRIIGNQFRYKCVMVLEMVCFSHVENELPKYVITMPEYDRQKYDLSLRMHSCQRRVRENILVGKTAVILAY